MKKVGLLIFMLTILSCEKAKKNELSFTHFEAHPGCKEEDELSKVKDTFDLQVLELYDSNIPYQQLIIKADSLIKNFANINSERRSHIAEMYNPYINYFKAEVLYKNGLYNESILELYKANGNYSTLSDDIAAAICANNIKLKNYDRAKSFADSTNWYLQKFVVANYFECVKNKTQALNIYQTIISDKSHAKRFYYISSIARIKELKSSQPIFLNEIIFPTRKPGFLTALQ